MWTRPFAAANTQGIGVLDDGTWLVLEAGQLLGLNPANGRVLWPGTGRGGCVRGPGADTRSRMVYVADRAGHLQAISLRQTEDQPALTLLWQADLNTTGTPTLLPWRKAGLSPSPGNGSSVMTRKAISFGMRPVWGNCSPGL